jgi:hypothetical protein
LLTMHGHRNLKLFLKNHVLIFSGVDYEISEQIISFVSR